MGVLFSAGGSSPSVEFNPGPLTNIGQECQFPNSKVNDSSNWDLQGRKASEPPTLRWQRKPACLGLVEFG